jgi:bacteriocin biosynthesis cyclodehydratase domain-containing protein
VTTRKFNKPRIPSHYYVWCDPPDSSGEESLHFVSERRAIKLKGRSFAEFERRVIPLLDGRRTLEEIAGEVEDVFALRDLEAGLELLAEQGVLEDGDAGSPNGRRVSEITPQLNLFHELGLNSAEAQRRLRSATVTIFGLSGAGPGVAESLAKTGIGRIRCVDSLPVSATDLYLSSGFSASDLGSLRSTAVERRFGPQFVDSSFEAVARDMSSDEAVASAIEGSDYLASCLDAGQSSLIYKLNRVCLQAGIRWTSCALAGSEVIIGPTVYPRITPCYLCYKMRVVACAGNPEDAFAFENLLDERKQDDSCRRENIAMGAGLAANLLALEIVRDIAGLTPVNTAGKVVIFNLLDLSSVKHVVLRKPWCPECFPPEAKKVPRPGIPHPAGQP